jgi:hypothetical protein
MPGGVRQGGRTPVRQARLAKAVGRTRSSPRWPRWDRETRLGLVLVGAATFALSAAFLYLLGFSILVEDGQPALRLRPPPVGQAGCSTAALDRRSNRTTQQDCPMELTQLRAVTAQLAPSGSQR